MKKKLLSIFLALTMVTSLFSGMTVTASAGPVVIPVTGVELDQATLSLAEGATAQLTATVIPNNATQTDVTWESSDNTVATVDSNGEVTAVAPGEATITVTTTDGDFTDTCLVTVTAAQSGGDQEPEFTDYIEFTFDDSKFPLFYGQRDSMLNDDKVEAAFVTGDTRVHFWDSHAGDYFDSYVTGLKVYKKSGDTYTEISQRNFLQIGDEIYLQVIAWANTNDIDFTNTRIKVNGEAVEVVKTNHRVDDWDTITFRFKLGPVLAKIAVDEDIIGGTVSVDKTTAEKGEVVTVTATPAAGYVLKEIIYRENSEGTTENIIEGNTFEVPRYNVLVTAKFVSENIVTIDRLDIKLDKAAESLEAGDFFCEDYIPFTVSQSGVTIKYSGWLIKATQDHFNNGCLYDESQIGDWISRWDFARVPDVNETDTYALYSAVEVDGVNYQFADTIVNASDFDNFYHNGNYIEFEIEVGTLADIREAQNAGEQPGPGGDEPADPPAEGEPEVASIEFTFSYDETIGAIKVGEKLPDLSSMLSSNAVYITDTNGQRLPVESLRFAWLCKNPFMPSDEGGWGYPDGENNHIAVLGYQYGFRVEVVGDGSYTFGEAYAPLENITTFADAKLSFADMGEGGSCWVAGNTGEFVAFVENPPVVITDVGVTIDYSKIPEIKEGAAIPGYTLYDDGAYNGPLQIDNENAYVCQTGWWRYDETIQEWVENEENATFEKDAIYGYAFMLTPKDGYVFRVNDGILSESTGKNDKIDLLYPVSDYDISFCFLLGTLEDIENEREEALNPPAPPSSGSGSYEEPPIQAPVSNDKNSVNVQATVYDNEATIKPLTDKQLDKILSDENASGDVVIDLTGLKKTIDGAAIPKKTLEAIVEAAEKAGNDTEHLVIKLTTAELKLDDAAMRAIVNQAKGHTIRIHFDDVGTRRLNDAQKSAVKGMDVRKGFEAYISVDGKRVSDFKGGEVEIIVPYAVPAGEDVAGFSVWYIDENGNPEKQKSTYDGKNKWFVVTHFSDYVIAYNADEVETDEVETNDYSTCPKDETCSIHPFTDTNKQAWYHDGVHYCIDNGYMLGTGDNLFAPNGITSRAQIVTILWRMEGCPSVPIAEDFVDVLATEWYYNAIRWASANGIVEGYGDMLYGVFGPNDAITREQMATILWRYCKYKGIDVSVGEDTNILSYEDAFDVSSWAMEAMQWACGSGMIQGVDKNNSRYLDPQGVADRSQSATMIFRFCTDIKE